MAIPTFQQAKGSGFDLLSQAAQERLRLQIGEAGGDIATVRQQIQEKLNRLDQQAVPKTAAELRAFQADRAFLVAQLEFLTLLEREAATKEQSQKPGLWARIRSYWQPQQ